MKGDFCRIFFYIRLQKLEFTTLAIPSENVEPIYQDAEHSPREAAIPPGLARKEAFLIAKAKQRINDNLKVKTKRMSNQKPLYSSFASIFSLSLNI